MPATRAIRRANGLAATAFDAGRGLRANTKTNDFDAKNALQQMASAIFSALHSVIPAGTRAKAAGVPAYVELQLKSDFVGSLEKEGFQCLTTQTQTFTVAKGSPGAGCLSLLPCLSHSSLRSLIWVHQLYQKVVSKVAQRVPNWALTVSSPQLHRLNRTRLPSNNVNHNIPTASGGRPLASAFCTFSPLIGAAQC
jgi:hypothetical protein